jgi:transglutaminase-like putative cysteine protease
MTPRKPNDAGPSWRAPHAGLRAQLASLLLVTCLAAGSASAQGLPTNAAHFKVRNYEVSTRVEADARAETTVRVERQALSARGAEIVGRYAQSYNTALQDLQIVEAYTEKPDGQRLPVGDDGVQRQSGVLAQGSGISWPGVEVVQLTYPDVRPGDTTVAVLRLRDRRLPLPGWSSDTLIVPDGVDFERIRWRVEAPAEAGLQVAVQGLASRRSQSGATTVWEAEGASRAQPAERRPMNTLRRWPHAMYSSLARPEDLATRFSAAFDERSAPTDEVRDLARQITRGLEAPRDKARAVHDWIRRNLRYVAIFVGVGGWEPNDPATILRRRWGDCKDHVLLMQALLRAAGVAARPALVRIGDEYDAPPLAVAWFNHVILYLPDLDLYADPTARTIPFGALPWAVMDKPVLVSAADGPQVLRTPRLDPAANRLHVKSAWRIDASGAAVLDLSVQAHGPAATELQDQLEAIPAGMGSAAVQRFLQAAGLQGSGFLQYPPLQRDRLEQSFTAQVELRNFARGRRAGSVYPHPAIRSLPIYILQFVDEHTAPARQYGTLCNPIIVREEFELRFDPVYRVSTPPAPLEIALGDELRFASAYAQQGQVLSGWREWRHAPPRHVCDPEDHARRRPAFEQIVRHLRETVGYERR